MKAKLKGGKVTGREGEKGMEVGPGEREGASPPAGKVFSTLFSIETGREQITHDRASCSQGAGIVHLMKS